jgi:hypothetical protein
MLGAIQVGFDVANIRHYLSEMPRSEMFASLSVDTLED